MKQKKWQQQQKKGKKLNKNSNNKIQYVIASSSLVCSLSCAWLLSNNCIESRKIAIETKPLRKREWTPKEDDAKVQMFSSTKKRTVLFILILPNVRRCFPNDFLVFMWFSSDCGCICIRTTSTCAYVWRCINESYSECLAVLLEFISKTITWNQTKQQCKKSDLSCICGLVFSFFFTF